MTNYETVHQAILDLKLDTLTKTQLLFAHLEIASTYKGLHPDDAFSIQGGWQGWLAIVEYQVWAIKDKPDCLQYPVFMMNAVDMLDKLEAFHLDDDDDDMLCRVRNIEAFLDEPEPDELGRVIGQLYALKDFHHGAPEEVATWLSDAYEALNWIHNNV